MRDHYALRSAGRAGRVDDVGARRRREPADLRRRSTASRLQVLGPEPAETPSSCGEIRRRHDDREARVLGRVGEPVRRIARGPSARTPRRPSAQPSSITTSSSERVEAHARPGPGLDSESRNACGDRFGPLVQLPVGQPLGARSTGQWRPGLHPRVCPHRFVDPRPFHAQRHGRGRPATPAQRASRSSNSSDVADPGVGRRGQAAVCGDQHPREPLHDVRVERVVAVPRAWPRSRLTSQADNRCTGARKGCVSPGDEPDHGRGAGVRSSLAHLPDVVGHRGVVIDGRTSRLCSGSTPTPPASHRCTAPGPDPARRTARRRVR